MGIAMQVADALAASHRAGIVHRDLKPDNIMLQQRGREHDFVKLLDFGIAKLTGDGKSSHRTRTGIVMGTPAYMSPEQCEGRANVDERTDIYALGIVLYEMLTGRVPFIGEGYGEILVQHLTQHPIPPSKYRMLPAHLEVVVLKALEKRPDMRYPTMDEFMRAMADPVGYVEAHGGPGQFLQRQLMPSSAPLPSVRLTPHPYTPVPGSISPPSGIYGHTSPAPTTLGAAAGEVQRGRSKTGFVIAALLVLVAAGVGVAIVVTGQKVDHGGEVAGGDHGSAVAAGGGSAIKIVERGSADTGSADTGSATTGSATTGSASTGSATTGSASTGSASTGSAATGSASTGSADAGSAAQAGSGSAELQVGSAGGSAAVPAISTITLSSTPAGAAIWIDGKDTGKRTPSPIEVDKARGAVTITFKLALHEDFVLRKLPVRGDVTKAVKLTKKRVTGTTSPGRGSGSGRTNDTTLERPE